VIDGFSLLQVAIASASTPRGKPAPKFHPTPRPKTAAERAEKRRAESVHSEIVAAALPPA